MIVQKLGLLGPMVPPTNPYDDPAWATVQTGSGQTYDGVPSSFYGEIPSLTAIDDATSLRSDLVGSPGIGTRLWLPAGDAAF